MVFAWIVRLTDSFKTQEFAYAELHCMSNYSFLRAASFPEELVTQASRLGYHALAITDECSVAGAVRAHLEAKQHEISLIIGSEFYLDDGTHLVLLATDRESYGQLSELITVARRNAKKGEYDLGRSLFSEHCPKGCLALYLLGQDTFHLDESGISWLANLFPGQAWVAVEILLNGNDTVYLQRAQQLSIKHKLPLCAAGGVHMHRQERRMLQDTLTAIRLGIPLSELGYASFPNSQRYLRSRRQLSHIFPPELLQETIRIADRCHFSLDALRYEYPKDLVPKKHTPGSWLRYLVEQGMRRRWPKGTPKKVLASVERELELVQELVYEPYFLTVYDVVRFARSRGILCQGRGSAANSVICYCLGITEVDPERMTLLFERFISRERNEPPDIDVDFEHERREEVIQYIYKRYGRQRAALAATVITYRSRSAIRDVGKALGFSLDQVDRLVKSMQWWDDQTLQSEPLATAGFSIHSPAIQRLGNIVNQLIGFPRHLSQHVGGFVIAEGNLSQLVPIENATMPNRTVIQWEKNDLEALGLLKIDILALGMLSAIRKALSLISSYSQKPMTLADIPAEDPAVYAMLHKADTIGVFQIESRAQMSMLPRLKPNCYYDLVIQIAIVRPGPIQGDMVHPYLARRNLVSQSRRSEVNYPNEAVKKVLERTLGVPIFQEQVMQLAMVAAGFSAGEADQLRRSMAAWKRRGGLDKFEHKLLSGMSARGYSEVFAKQIVRQIQGFGEYGFPESHSASFALLAYASSWLKCYHHAAFTCALLNSQPMGFYAPAQLIQDAKRHGVTIRAIDVRFSDRDCSLEEVFDEEVRAKKMAGKKFALRLGLRMVKGLSSTGMEKLLKARQIKPFRDVQDLLTQAKLQKADIECLAAADALKGLAGHRFRAFWQVSGVEQDMPLFSSINFNEAEVMLRSPTEGETIIEDYTSVGLSLQRHPVALLRDRLGKRGVQQSKVLWQLKTGAIVKTAGLVVGRQRPGTASGVIFVTLEDEVGYINVIVWPKLAEAQGRVLLRSRLLLVSGTIQQESGVLHLIAHGLEDLSVWLGQLVTSSRDFH